MVCPDVYNRVLFASLLPINFDCKYEMSSFVDKTTNETIVYFKLLTSLTPLRNVFYVSAEK